MEIAKGLEEAKNGFLSLSISFKPIKIAWEKAKYYIETLILQDLSQSYIKIIFRELSKKFEQNSKNKVFQMG